MKFVYLPDGGFRLDLLAWWGPIPAHANEGPNAPAKGDMTAYDLLIGGEEVRRYTTATLEGFGACVTRAMAALG